MKPAKSFLFALITPLLGVLILLAVIELVLTFAGYAPLQARLRGGEGQALSHRFSQDKILRYELNPGFSGFFLQTPIRINSLGFRGPEISVEKGDRRRIIVLGDSITFAQSVSYESTFPALLEAKLRAVDPRVEVLNFGVNGYDTVQEVRFLEKTGLALSPDLVILAYCLNDVGITDVDAQQLSRPAGGTGGLPFYVRTRLGQWIYLRLGRLRAARAAKLRLEKPRSDENFYGDLFPPADPDPVLEAAVARIDKTMKRYSNRKFSKKKVVTDDPGGLWLGRYASYKNIGKIRFAFGELKRLSEEHGFKVRVLIVPFLYKIGRAYVDMPAHVIVRHEAQRLKLRVIDALKPMQAYGFEKINLDRVHLNSAGHEVLSGILFDALKGGF